MKKTDSTTDIRQEILNTIKTSHHPLTKNQIAKILGLKGEQRVVLKQILKELYQSGEVVRGSRRRLAVEASTETTGIGDIVAVEVFDVDEDGDLLAHPTEWPENEKLP